MLFKAYGAAQDETVFKFASDVFADQSIEIDRMHQMLEDSSPQSYEAHEMTAQSSSARPIAQC